MAEHVFSGVCARCKESLTAKVVLESNGGHEVSPPPVIGSYCNCPAQRPNSSFTIKQFAQAVPLTLRGLPE